MIPLRVQEVVLRLKASPRTASASAVSAFNDSPLEKKHEEGISAKLRRADRPAGSGLKAEKGSAREGFLPSSFLLFPILLTTLNDCMLKLAVTLEPTRYQLYQQRQKMLELEETTWKNSTTSSAAPDLGGVKPGTARVQTSRGTG